jgi:hypothetical protein
MLEKLAASKNESSNRRRFLRRIAGLTAVSALTGLIHSRNYIDPAFAGNGSGLIIGQANSGSSITTLTASPEGDAAFQVETSASFEAMAIGGIASSSKMPEVSLEGITTL